MTIKHARRGEMVGHFASPSIQAKRVGVTTKHARKGEMVAHFALPSMQARRVWGDNQACKVG